MQRSRMPAMGLGLAVILGCDGVFAEGPGAAARVQRCLQGRDQARRPRFDSGLGAVHADEGARGRAEHPVRSVRRHRPGRLVAVRRPDQHADAAEAGRQRPDVLAVAHDGALLADPLHAPDRTQPPPERHGLPSPRRPTASPARTAASRTQCATIGQILQDGGWSTFWLGKNHNVPEQDVASGASRKQWPLQKGFDRFYGFLGGETNQWYPDLVEDNHFIEQPYSPEEGYHLSKDLADQAIEMIRDQKASNPSKPWFMWFCPGANHAPHHAPQDYIDKYKGKFDDGYEAYREWVLPRMIAKGILPEGHPAHAAQPDAGGRGEPGRLRAPLGFAQRRREEAVLAPGRGLRRLLGVHRRPGRPHHRLPGEERPAREHHRPLRRRQRRVRRGQPQRLGQREQVLQRLPGRAVREHEATSTSWAARTPTSTIPTGWAAAFSTPFKMFKRYSEYSGGTCDPLVISWPKGIKARGEVRNQYHHSTDIVPTILDICGLEMPKVYKGVEQYPLSGVSMRYTFDAKPDAPTQKKRQYYAMLGTRGIWEDGWKAVAVHAPLTGKGHFDKDEWELYHVDVDRSESKDLAKEHPEKLQALIKAWFEEAEKNLVLPLDDRTALEITRHRAARPRSRPASGTSTIPDTAPVPEGVAVNVRGRSYKILADVEITDPNCSGVIFAHGSRFGGHSLFIKDKKLYYVYNFLGIKPEQKFVSPRAQARQVHARHGVHPREARASTTSRSAQTKLYVNDKVVAEGPMRTQAGKFTLSGDGLCIGYDSGDAVSQEYKTPGQFKGGTILFVGVTVEKTQYLDLETEARRLMAVQ